MVDNEFYFEITGLPSKNLAYPPNTKIEGRSLKLAEVKKLATMSDNFDLVVNEILKKTIRGINVDDILIPDKLFLILWLRANTYRESGYMTSYRCGLCNSLDDYEFNINNLTAVYLTKEFSKDKMHFEFQEKEITYKFLTIGDDKKINQFKVAYTPIFKNMSEDDIRYAAMIETIDGKKLEMNEKYELLNSLSPSEYSYIIGNLERFDFGITNSIDVTCNKCGGTAPVGITFHREFFIPRYKVQ